MSASMLYPLEVLKTRMQASNNDDQEGDADADADADADLKKSVGMWEYAKQLYEREGLQVYLNGIEASAFQSSMEKALYFFAYTTLKNIHGTLKVLWSDNPTTIPMSATTNLILGCLAEWVHLPVTLPIDCWSTAIQTSQKQNAFALLMTILKAGNMYKGIQSYYVLCFKPALQYTVFEQVKAAILRSRTNKTLSAAESFLLGMVARIVATVAVFPFVRAKVVLQSRKLQGEESNSPQPPAGILKLLRQVYESEGVRGLYQGLGPELTRGAISAALMLMIKEQLNGGIKKMLYGPPPNSRRTGPLRK